MMLNERELPVHERRDAYLPIYLGLMGVKVEDQGSYMCPSAKP